MKQFYILGQRVNTYKFGLGTIVGFEVLNLGNKRPVEIHEHNTNPGQRIIVKIDDPTKWILSEGGRHLPHLSEDDIMQD